MTPSGSLSCVGAERMFDPSAEKSFDLIDIVNGVRGIVSDTFFQIS